MSDHFNRELAGYLLTTQAIRERCQQIFSSVLTGAGCGFTFDVQRLEGAAASVAQVVIKNYPDLEVPYHSRWRHLSYGNPDRLHSIFSDASPEERGRLAYDLVIPSILLDAGAGPDWSYVEQGQSYSRSEGLAVASVDMFKNGFFSSQSNQPLQTDSNRLHRLTLPSLKEAMQVSSQNPMVGLEGRLQLLKGLGLAIQNRPDIFAEEARLGKLFDYFCRLANDHGNRLKASFILEQVLEIFGSIWPGRSQIDGINLGDTWRHPAIQGRTPQDQFVPFHKLSQWLTYSLIEPLEDIGINVTDLDDLTGLPEYRNGGLLIDTGVLQLKDPSWANQEHLPSEPLIVEWRAATVCLLDLLAPKIVQLLPANNKSWSLAKILQGGTWSAGRELALSKRQGGIPPLKIKSDGTVF